MRGQRSKKWFLIKGPRCRCQIQSTPFLRVLTLSKETNSPFLLPFMITNYGTSFLLNSRDFRAKLQTHTVLSRSFVRIRKFISIPVNRLDTFYPHHPVIKNLYCISLMMCFSTQSQVSDIKRTHTTKTKHFGKKGFKNSWK